MRTDVKRIDPEDTRRVFSLISLFHFFFFFKKKKILKHVFIIIILYLRSTAEMAY